MHRKASAVPSSAVRRPVFSAQAFAAWVAVFAAEALASPLPEEVYAAADARLPEASAALQPVRSALAGADQLPDE